MKHQINQDEFRVLAALHDKAKGYGQEYSMIARDFAAEMNMEDEVFQRSVSYLREFQLAGATISRSSAGTYVVMVWLTGLGENLMRDIENEPGIAKKIGLKVATETWDIIKQTVINVSTAYMVAQVTGSAKQPVG